MTFGDKISRLVERDRWPSLRRVALEAGIDDSTLQRAVREGGSLSVDKAIAVAKALRVPCEWLFSDSMDWPPPPAANVPPIAIHPWPPIGITWAEVQIAISQYVSQRALAASSKANDVLASVDPEYVNYVLRSLRTTFDSLREAGAAMSSAANEIGVKTINAEDVRELVAQLSEATRGSERLKRAMEGLKASGGMEPKKK